MLSKQAAAEVQQAFSVEYYPTVWQVLPLYEDFMVKWRGFRKDPSMKVLHLALDAGIASLEKYYNKAENSPVHIVVMCEHHHLSFSHSKLNLPSDLHPCIKGEYFQAAWTPKGQSDAC